MRIMIFAGHKLGGLCGLGNSGNLGGRARRPGGKGKYVESEIRWLTEILTALAECLMR